MAIFRQRLPQRSQTMAVFAACALPIFAWSIIRVLRELPSWLLRLSVWDLVGVLAYTQAFALIESVVLLVGILVLSILLPARLLRDELVPVATALVLLASFWMILIHFYGERLRDLGAPILLVTVFLILASLLITYALTLRNQRLSQVVSLFNERLSMLSYLYLSIGTLSLLVVLLRNF